MSNNNETENIISDHSFRSHTPNTDKIKSYIDDLYKKNKFAKAELLIRLSKIAYQILRSNNFDDNICLSVLALPFLSFKENDWDKILSLSNSDVVSILKAYHMTREITDDISYEEKLTENLKQLLVAAGIDIRVIFVKIGYWYAELKLIDSLSKDEAQKLAEETLQIYAPISHRLGLYLVKNELEKLSFGWLNPNEYKKINDFIKQRQIDDSEYYQKLKSFFIDLLKREGIEFNFSYRIKEVYSIYKKSKKYAVQPNELYDLIACRILVKETIDCYRVLGLIHSVFKPVAGRFKDYISQPKANGYQSLHTTVFDEDEVIFEVQIRTEIMHEQSEYGIAAHWAYKEHISNKSDDKHVLWIRELLKNFSYNTENQSDILKALKRDLYGDYIYVFTPKGKMVKLPKGASVLDFAYSIHSQVGHHCAGAKINGKFVSIKSILENGQQIEIITSSGIRPNSGWLNFCVTNRSQQMIRSDLKTRSLNEANKLGFKILIKSFDKYKLKISNPENNPLILKFIKNRSLNSYGDLLNSIGSGDINSDDLAKYIISKNLETPKVAKLINNKSKTENDLQASLSLQKSSIPMRIALCCHPVSGDKLVGLISNSGIIKIHRSDCYSLVSTKFDQNQFLPLSWNGEEIEQNLTVEIVFELKNNILLLNKINNIFGNLNLHVKNTSTEDIGEGRLKFLVNLELTDLNIIEKIKSKLKKYPTVQVKTNF